MELAFGIGWSEFFQFMSVHDPTPVAGCKCTARVTAPLAGARKNPAIDRTMTTTLPVMYAFHRIISTPGAGVEWWMNDHRAHIVQDGQNFYNDVEGTI
jgi:hypothetical protein